MMIPGGNLLTLALQTIGSQTLKYSAFTERERDAVGNWTTTYASAIDRQGSFQPVPKDKYEYLGLDFQKEYWNFYTPGLMTDIGRDVAADYLTFQGQRYNCLSATPWGAVDGWTAMLCVKVQS